MGNQNSVDTLNDIETEIKHKGSFNPGIAIPPGETIVEILEDRKMSQQEFAEKLKEPPEHVKKIIEGTAVISDDISIKLETVHGIKATFWNKLEAKYQGTKAHLNKDCSE